jgi:hypothetical protein
MILAYSVMKGVRYRHAKTLNATWEIDYYMYNTLNIDLYCPPISSRKEFVTVNFAEIKTFSSQWNTKLYHGNKNLADMKILVVYYHEMSFVCV